MSVGSLPLSNHSLSASTQAMHRRPGPLRPLWPLWIDPRVRRVKSLMERNLHRPLHLDELARAEALSASRLSHLFKRQTGLSPAQQFKLVRLRRAKQLLESSALSVKEVATSVGLDASRFVREFRRAYGATPLQGRGHSQHGKPSRQIHLTRTHEKLA